MLRRGLLGVISIGLVLPVQARAQAVLYVDVNATGRGDGSSWCDGFVDLQDALAAATGTAAEIRVAGGVYRPGAPQAARTATFQLTNGVTLLGGYAGCGASDPDERDIVLHETVLSGDLSGNDGPDFRGYDENCYHVVTGPTSSSPDAPAELDGFTITGGYAVDDDSLVTLSDRGGGLHSFGGNPTVRRCTFSKNAGIYGGAVFTREGDPTFESCSFIGNWAWRRGGAMVNRISNQGQRA